LGRTVVRPLDPPRNRKARDRVYLVAMALVLAFAVVGVVSAGVFLAGKFSSSPAHAKTHKVSSGNPVAVADVARAQAQATAIVKAAQDASSSIVKSATKSAQKRAAAILAAARHRAAAVPTAVPAPVIAPTAIAVAPTAVAPGFTTVPTAVPFSGTTVTGPAGTAPTPPNLSGVPANWQVVGYNATFGSGPGSAGSVSVINRGRKTFSGVVTVRYTRGGSATAVFGGLASGQSALLALNGPAYTGGGYHIVLGNLH
jgi:hypothetical protein